MTKPKMHIDKGILELESKIGLRKKFFVNLLKEDDWSFIIKLHALIEAACSHLLLYHFKEPNLSDVVNRLELSGKSTGKVIFLQRLGLLGKVHCRFISSLSELRNNLVHDVRNSEFSLDDMIQTYDSNALRNFAVSFSPSETVARKFASDPRFKGEPDPIWSNQSKIESLIERARKDPKFHLWIGAHSVLTTIIDMFDYSDYKQWAKSTNQIEEEQG